MLRKPSLKYVYILLSSPSKHLGNCLAHVADLSSSIHTRHSNLVWRFYYFLIVSSNTFCVRIVHCSKTKTTDNLLYLSSIHVNEWTMAPWHALWSTCFAHHLLMYIFYSALLLEMSTSVTVNRNSVWVSPVEVVTQVHNVWTQCTSKGFIILSSILIMGKYVVAQCSALFHNGQVIPVYMHICMLPLGVCLPINTYTNPSVRLQ